MVIEDDIDGIKICRRCWNELEYIKENLFRSVTLAEFQRSTIKYTAKQGRYIIENDFIYKFFVPLRCRKIQLVCDGWLYFRDSSGRLFDARLRCL